MANVSIKVIYYGYTDVIERHIKAWIAEHTTGRSRIVGFYGNGFKMAFENPDDALAFKMRFV